MKAIFFEWGPITIYAYGTFMAIAFMVAIFFLVRHAEKADLTSSQVMDLGLVSIIGGILGARVAYVLSHWSEFQNNCLEILMIHHGGLVFYGGILGGCIALIVFLKIKKLPILKTIDIFLPALVLGHAIGRIGCFLNGCCYGRPTQLFCAVDFPIGTLPYQVYGPGHAVHPVQIYSFLLLLLLFCILSYILLHKRYHGQVLGFYLLTYPFLRFNLEYFRGDRIFVNSLSLFQIVSVVLFVCGIVLHVYLKKKR